MSRRARTLNSRGYPWAGLDPERRGAILLIGGIAAVIVFALALIGYGYYADRVAPKHATVLKVGDRGFDYAFVERRAKAELARGRLDTSNLGDSLFRLLQSIQREEIVRRSAESIGISVSDDEIEARYRVRLSLAEDASREQLAARLRSELLRLGLSLSEYRDIAKVEVLERKLRAQFEASVPSEAEHVDLRLIKTATQAEALRVRERLDAGDSFGIVAVEMSSHPSARQTAGDLSWTPRGALPAQVEEVAFVLEAGTRSDIIETDEGFFIVQANGLQTRPVTGDGKNNIVQQSIDSLLAQTRKTIGAEITMTTQQIQRLALSVSPSRA